ncbi:nitroreductase family protein [Magnetovibrio sp.]|uniref:nitroreductase family protein n=1 Tax=Magnetovibrio sp. TaxID=2024836 RepID=UPI002F920C60
MNALSVSTAIHNRTAIRTFDPSFIMSGDDKRRLLSLAMQAPSAWNIQHWRFVLVEDPAQRAALQAAAGNQAQFTDSAMLVAIVVDLEAWKRNPARYFDAVGEDIAEVLAAKVIDFYTDRDWLARDDAMRSCGLAAQTLMLAATEMGLATCPMDLFEPETVQDLLNLPSGHVTAMFVAIGKAKADQDAPRMGRLPYDEVVVIDRFPNA